MITYFTLQKSEMCKIHSNWVKINLKTSENYSKASENHPKKEWKSLQNSEFYSFGKLTDMTEGQLFCFELCLCEFPPKVKFTLLGWFLRLGVIIIRFGMIFTCFGSDFHSVGVDFTIFTFLKSNHFTLFTLRAVERVTLLRFLFGMHPY